MAFTHRCYNLTKHFFVWINYVEHWPQNSPSGCCVIPLSPESPVREHPAGQVWVSRQGLGSHHSGGQGSHIQAVGAGRHPAPQCCSGPQAPLGAGGGYCYILDKLIYSWYSNVVWYKTTIILPVSFLFCIRVNYSHFSFFFFYRTHQREVFQLLTFYRGTTENLESQVKHIYEVHEVFQTKLENVKMFIFTLLCPGSPGTPVAGLETGWDETEYMCYMVICEVLRSDQQFLMLSMCSYPTHWGIIHQNDKSDVHMSTGGISQQSGAFLCNI